MRDSTYVSWTEASRQPCPTLQQAQAALAELTSVLERAKESMSSCQMVTHQTRKELMLQCTTFKNTINVSADEYTYDLAALLDLVALTAFGTQQHRYRSALELTERAIEVLRRSLTGSAIAERECADMTEEVWTWLGNSNGMAMRF